MDALLVSGGLAAGGWLLNAKQENEKNTSQSKDIYDNRVLDSKMYERQTMETHLAGKNTVSKLLERPESSRSSNIDNMNQSMSLTGEMMRNDDFKHNNMVPFYGSNVKQNTDSDANSGLVERYTGVSDLSIRKEETASLFDLQQENIYGTQNVSDKMRDRYSASNFKQGVPLIEPVRVGPGLNKGYNSQPSGGFQQNDALDYARQPTVDELRVATNPKMSYEGRIVRGFKGTRRGMTPVVNQNRVIRFHSHGDIPRMNTTVVTSGETSREVFTDKPTNRQDTLYSYSGPAGPSVLKGGESLEAYSNQTTHKQDLEGYGFRNATNQNRESKLKIQYCSEVRKEETKEKSYLGHATSLVNKIVAPVQDLLRPTLKETNIHDGSIERNFSSVRKSQTIHDTNDVARTTLKELGIHDNRLGSINVSGSGRAEDPAPTNKTARETLKQWIEHANPTGPGVRNSAYNIDNAKKTVKETTGDNKHKGIATQSKGAAYITNPKNAPETSRQHVSTTEYSGQANGRTYGAYSVTDTIAPETNKENTSNNSYIGNGQGEEKPTSYADIYNATLNDLREGISKGREPTKTSIKQVSDAKHIGTMEERQGLEQRTIMSMTPVQNTMADSDSVNMKTSKCQFDTSSRLDSSNVDAFVENPYTQPLDSTR
tara:strand:+ start:948 stop:2915 length:1968 start_codon:yes stop_codon:yes gene_type:complete